MLEEGGLVDEVPGTALDQLGCQALRLGADIDQGRFQRLLGGPAIVQGLGRREGLRNREEGAQGVRQIACGDLLGAKGLLRRQRVAMLVDEPMLETGMILASCGIAFALRYVRASVEGGVELGCPAGQATHIVAATLRGAAELLLQRGEHPETEIDRVTTPGGITVRGLNEMEQAGFSAAVIRGLKACK